MYCNGLEIIGLHVARRERKGIVYVYANQSCGSVMTTYLGPIGNLRWILTLLWGSH